VMRAVAPPERAVQWLNPALERWVLFLGPQQRESWLKERRRIERKGFRFGRESSFALPRGAGERILLELIRA
jgi:16S rRNA G527 N7-methylase RsmG